MSILIEGGNGPSSEGFTLKLTESGDSVTVELPDGTEFEFMGNDWTRTQPE